MAQAQLAAVDEPAVEELKAQKLAVAHAELDAALAQLTLQHEGAKEQAQLKADRKLAFATTQIVAAQAEQVAELDAALERERLSVDQHRFQDEVSLDVTTLDATTLSARHEEAAEAQKSLAASEAQRSEQRVAAQIAQQREAELLQLELAYVQQKVALEQQRARDLAAVDRAALAQLEQQRAAQWMPFAPLPPVPDFDFAKRQIEERFSAAAAQLSTQFEGQKDALVQGLERQQEMAKAEIEAGLQQVERSVSAPRVSTYPQFVQYPYAAYAPAGMCPELMPAALYPMMTRPRGASHITDVSMRQ